MKRKVLLLCAASFAGTCALRAADGTLLAETTAAASFDIYTSGNATYGAASAAEVALLPRVTWRIGETVTATARDGVTTTLASSAASAGSSAFTPDKGGVWTLANSAQGEASVGVAWAVNGDGGTLASGGAASPFGIDSMQEGPDRRTTLRDLLPVSYSGDNWIGDAAKASSLTFVSPVGVQTTLNRTGTGATQFAFDKPGNWTVRLAMSDNTVREAVVFISGGFVIVIR